MKMNKKRMTSLAMAALMTTGMAFADHKSYETTIDGVKYLPVRDVMESYGYEVIWNPETKAVELLKGAGFNAYYIGSNSFVKNKMAPQKLQHNIKMVGGKTYISAADLEVNMELKNQDENPAEDPALETASLSGLIIREIREDGVIIASQGQGEAHVYLDLAEVSHYGKEGAYTITKADIDKEMVITHPSYMTAIYPPQYKALKVEVLPKDTSATLGQVKEIETGDRNAVLITDQYGNRVDVLILVNEDTVIENTKGEKLALADIKEGSEITAYHSIAMTMSIPGQTNGFKLVVEQ